MNLRRYIYADVERINSFFSQLYGDIDTVSHQEQQTIKKKLDAEVQLPAILHGFLPGNLSGELERDRGTSLTVNSRLSIEKKVELLAGAATGKESEPLIASPMYHDRLVLGKADVVSSRFFSSCNKEILQSYNCDDIISFLQIAPSVEGFRTIWKGMLETVIDAHSKNNSSIIPTMTALRYPQGDSVVIQLITTNTEKPIIIPFSLGKILLSASDIESINYIARTTNFKVLGFQSKVNTNVFMLKPLAIWTIIKCTPVERDSHIERGRH